MTIRARWDDDAACRTTTNATPDDFFAYEDSEAHARALAVCATCPVATQCLNDALARRDYGVRGGISESQRTEMLRAQSRIRPEAVAA